MKLVFLLVILSLLSADCFLPRINQDTKHAALFNTETIYIVSHGWHTGFVIPANSIQKLIPQLQQRFGTIPYVEIGWGDKGFYQAKQVTVGLTLQAMFWSIGSVIHVVATPETVESYFSTSQVEKLCLSAKNYADLLQFIAAGFARNQQGQVIALQKGRYGNSQFYAGAGTYHLLNTCNKWVANGLQRAGMQIEPLFKLTAGSIMDTVKEQAINFKCNTR